MADPTKYAPKYSFSGFQASSPDRPLPAPQLDNELQNIGNTTEETITALQTIRRSDGTLNNGVVTLDSLDPNVRIAIATGTVDVDLIFASQGEAEAGVGSGLMTATRTGQAITALVPGLIASASSAAIQSALDGRRINVTAPLTGGGSLGQDRTIGITIASQADAQAGISSAGVMTPLRTAQAIAALAPASGGSGGVTPADVQTAIGNARGAVNGIAPLDAQQQLPFVNMKPGAVSQVFNVKLYGAKGDNQTDDTQAINAAFSAAKVNGGLVYFPAGNYVVTDANPANSEAILDATTASNTKETTGRISIRGDGANNTRIRYAGASAPDKVVLDVGCVATAEDFGVRSYSSFTGFTVENTLGQARRRVNLRMNRMAFWEVRSCWFFGGSTNVLLESCLSGAFYSCEWMRSSYNVVARKGSRTGAFSGPNAISFYQCVGNEADVSNIHLVEPGRVNIIGGSIENNPGIGVSVERKLPAGTQGATPNAVLLQGIYFEKNAGAADCYFEATGSSDIAGFTVRDCDFHRVDTPFTTNNIFVGHGSGGVDLRVDGCSFRGYGSYTPSAGRPYIAVAGAGLTANRRLALKDNAYGSTVERPSIATTRPGLTAIIAGRTNNGSVQSGTVALGWSVSTVATGRYRISMDFPVIRPIPDIQFIGGTGKATLYDEDKVNGSWFEVQVYDAANNPTAGGFSFIIFPSDPRQ